MVDQFIIKEKQMNSKGKSGTLAVEDFEELSGYAEEYGVLAIGQKIAKVCNRLAEGYKHEFVDSSIASAWSGLSSKISSALGTSRVSVPSEVFSFLGNITTSYGPEVVIQKLAKIAKRMDNVNDAKTLSVLFPKVKTSSVSAPAASANTGMGTRTRRGF